MDFLQQITDARLSELYRYWLSRCGGRTAPARGEIDPADIPGLLPHLLLVEMLEGGLRQRYRLVGTEVERHFGCHMTGRCVDELMRGAYLDYIRSLYRTLIERRAPVYSENSYERAETGFGYDIAPSVFRTCRLMLPLSRDGTIIDMVLAGQTFAIDRRMYDCTVVVTQDHFGRVTCAVP